jgi:anaphase-promoting complex subunit 3
MELTRRGKKQMQDAATRLPSMPAAPTKTQIDPKKEEAQLYILELYRKLGAGYFSLSRYHCPEALQAFNSLPVGQKETPWVQCQVGKAYYEMANYAEVCFISYSVLSSSILTH